MNIDEEYCYFKIVSSLQMINTPSLVSHLSQRVVWQYLFALLFSVGKSILFPKVQQALSCVMHPVFLHKIKKKLTQPLVRWYLNVEILKAGPQNFRSQVLLVVLGFENTA